MSENRSKIGGFLVTVVVAVLLLLWLLLGSVSILLDNNLPQQPRQDSIIMEDLGGDPWVKLGDIPDPNLPSEEPAPAEEDAQNEAADDSKPEGEDVKDAGEPQPQQPKTVTAKQPSPMKVKEKEKEKTPEVKKTGPTKANDKPKATPQAKQSTQQVPTESKVSKGMKNAFAKGKGSGPSSGSPNGNSSSGSLDGRGSLGGGLVGWTVAYWGRPHSPYDGSVTVQVTVNARGKVVSARAVSGTGSAWGSSAVRKSCEQESLKSAFSVPENRTTMGKGTITWRFK